MGIFVCDNCECVENTACGHFWTKEIIVFKEFPKGTALCSECMPAKFSDCSLNKEGGKWHGKFPKVKWDGKREVMNR